MRALLMMLALFTTAATCMAAEDAGAVPQTPQPREMLDLVKQNRATVHAQMLAYVKSARALCIQIVLTYPESAQAGEACDLLGELFELAAILTHESDPMSDIQISNAGKMWDQAEQYADMDTLGSIRSAEFIYREIIRRYPETRHAVNAAMRLTQLSAALSVMSMWEQAERQASLNTRESLRAAENLCREIISLYPESPQAVEAAKKLIEVSAALKKLPEPPPQPAPKEEPEAAPAPAQEEKPAFSFDSDSGTEWLLPKPEDLYTEPEDGQEAGKE